MNVDLIAQRFQKSHQHYLQYAIVQKQMVHDLMALMHENAISSPSCVLEIGCGSGYLTQQFLKYYQPDNLYLNDLYDEIALNVTQGNVHYKIGDIQTIDLTALQFDLILSSAVLQWIYPLDDLLNKLYQHLQPHGYLVFSSFLEDNLKEIKQLIGQGLCYYTMEQLTECLTRTGFDIQVMQQKHHQLYFKQPYDVLKHLKYTGVTANQQKFVWNKQRLQQFYSDYQQFICDGQYPLTYHSVYVVAKRGTN